MNFLRNEKKNSSEPQQFNPHVLESNISIALQLKSGYYHLFNSRIPKGQRDCYFDCYECGFWMRRKWFMVFVGIIIHCLYICFSLLNFVQWQMYIILILFIFPLLTVISRSQFYLRCVLLIISSSKRGIIGHEVDFVVMTLYTLRNFGHWFSLFLSFRFNCFFFSFLCWNVPMILMQ